MSRRYYKVPLKGSKLTIYGASLAFRPQIYRFDVSCKLLAEMTHLKFQNGAEAFPIARDSPAPADLGTGHGMEVFRC